jgi:hypothetical protein
VGASLHNPQSAAGNSQLFQPFGELKGKKLAEKFAPTATLV